MDAKDHWNALIDARQKFFDAVDAANKAGLTVTLSGGITGNDDDTKVSALTVKQTQIVVSYGGL